MTEQLNKIVSTLEKENIKKDLEISRLTALIKDLTYNLDEYISDWGYRDNNVIDLIERANNI